MRSNDAEGTLVEDVGVSGQPYDMTRRDIFGGNRDLIDHCAAMLAAQPRTRLEIGRRGRTLSVKAEGLDQLDVYADGHPAGVPITPNRNGARRIPIPQDAREFEVVGFSQGVVRQRRRLTIATGP